MAKRQPLKIHSNTNATTIIQAVEKGGLLLNYKPTTQTLKKQIKAKRRIMLNFESQKAIAGKK